MLDLSSKICNFGGQIDSRRFRVGIRLWSAIFIAVVIALPARASSDKDLTVDQLKERVSSAAIGDRPKFCVEIAQKQLSEADKLYAASEIEKAQAPLTDVVAFSELARDYSVQSHKYQKQTEIAVRAMTRKLNGVLHTLGHEDQQPVKDALRRLERVRDDLLASMFKKGAK